MSTKRGTRTKKSQSSITIEQLLTEKRWDDVRKRIQRTNSPKRIGELLYYSADFPNVPDDIFEILLSKLDGKREKSCVYQGGSIVKYRFWSVVCNCQRQRDYTKSFKAVFQNRSVSSLKLFMNACLDNVGILSSKEARDTICSLWNDFLISRNQNENRSYYGYGNPYVPSSFCPDEIELAITNIHSMDDLIQHEELYILWLKTELLIKCTHKNKIDKSSKDLDMVHMLIWNRVPRLIVFVALRLYPHQVGLKDKYGRIPLHWAALMNDLSSEEGFFFKFKDEMLQKRYVEIVLEPFPEGATCVDNDGSLPLHVLLDLEYRSWTDNDWMKRCVLALMEQAPEALSIINKLNHMMPFMTAACIHDKNTIMASTKREEDDMFQRKIDLTYSLLRENPSVLAMGRVETAHEKYYRRKVEELQIIIAQLKGEDHIVNNTTEQHSSKRQRLES